MTFRHPLIRTTVLLSLLAAFTALAGAEEITVSLWGGGYGEEWKKLVAEPFTAETGIKVIADLGPSQQRLTKFIATGGSGVDLFFITDYQMAAAKLRGALQPVDPKNVPNMAHLLPLARDPLGDGTCPAIALLAVGLAYNKAAYPTPPTSWKELGGKDPKKRPAFMDINFSVGPLVMVQLAEINGGSIDNMTPGFKMVAAQKDTAKFFKVFEVLDWINRGEVAVAPMLNTFVKKDPNVPLAFSFPADGVPAVVNLACVSKSAKNKSGAEKLLNYYLSPAVQSRLALAFGETPVVTNATIPLNVPYELVPPSRIKDLKVFDPMKIARQRDAWAERFQEEIVAR